MSEEVVQLDIQAILERLPHRYPFLLVDRVLECVPGKSIRAHQERHRSTSRSSPAIFPHRPVMPGVMILEALAQAAGILCFVTAGVIPDEDTRFYFVGIDKARFRRPVEPGDQLMLTATLERTLRGIWKFSTAALVGDEEVAHADMMVAPEAPVKAHHDRSARGRVRREAQLAGGRQVGPFAVIGPGVRDRRRAPASARTP